MDKTPPVLVSGICSLTDARYCAGMNVPICTLLWDESGKTTLDAHTFTAIRAWIEGVDWWGEYEGSDANALREWASQYDLRTWIVPENFPGDPALEDLEIIRIGAKQTGKQAVRLPDGLENGPLVFLQELSPDRNQPLIVLNPPAESEWEALIQTFPNLLFRFLSGPEDRPGWMDLGELQDVLERWEDS